MGVCSTPEADHRVELSVGVCSTPAADHRVELSVGVCSTPEADHRVELSVGVCSTVLSFLRYFCWRFSVNEQLLSVFYSSKFECMSHVLAALYH